MQTYNTLDDIPIFHFYFQGDAVFELEDWVSMTSDLIKLLPILTPQVLSRVRFLASELAAAIGSDNEHGKIKARKLSLYLYPSSPLIYPLVS